MNKNKTNFLDLNLKYINIMMIIIVGIWIFLLGIAFYIDISKIDDNILHLARTEAVSSYNHDLEYRRWNSMHGGVYVPITEITQPDPNLSPISNRDVTTKNDLKLTLINPENMIRQVHELNKTLHEDGVKNHVTSLYPIQALNKPDDWEQKSLKLFEQGNREFSSVETIDGEPYFRYIKALVTEESCLKCHFQQGYKVGDILGGISISVPLNQYYSVEHSHIVTMAISYSLIFLFGLIGILWGTHRIKNWLKQKELMAKQLLESQERLNLVLEGSGLGYWDWNIETGEVQRNPQWAAILGYSIHEMETTTEQWTDLIHPDDREKAWQAIQNHLDGKTASYECEYRMKAQNGEFRWILDRAKAVKRDSQNKPLRMCGTHTDITQRKNTEEALTRSEKQFKSLFESMTEGVVLHEMDYDSQGKAVNYRLLEVNPAFEKHTGIQAKSAQNQLATEVYDSVNAPYLDLYLQTAETGIPQKFEVYFPPLHRHFNVTVISYEPNKFATIFEDITSRKMAEEQLQFTQFAVDHAADIIYLADDKGHIIYTNEMASYHLGYTKDEFLECSVFDLDPAFPQEEWQTFCEKLKSKEKYRIESMHRHKDGTEFPVEIMVNYLTYNNKEFICSYVRDITERKELEDKLLHSQKMEAIGKLAGGIAHDFNNLVLVITGYSDLILQTTPETKTLKTWVEEIKKAGGRAASLTHQLLAYSRKQMMEPKIIDLNELIQFMKKMLQRLIGEDIDLIFKPSPDLGKVKVDPTQVEQIVMNLAVNSRDAMPMGGKITIETANAYFDEGYVKTHHESIAGHYVMLAFTDNGSGMDKDVLQRIFEPYYTTKEKDKGTGLGLATVYGIVKQSHGHIFVYSEPGRGTTFKLYFPQVESENVIISSKEPDIQTLKGNETILLVEDDDTVRDFITITLQDQGYTVFIAEDGEKAFKIVTEIKEPIHLLITDIILPKISGRVVADRILGEQPGIKVLFMSGYTENAIIHHGTLDEGIQFIQKPFSPNTFLQKVREVLEA